jgi:hypothetical protein
MEAVKDCSGLLNTVAHFTDISSIPLNFLSAYIWPETVDVRALFLVTVNNDWDQDFKVLCLEIRESL